MVLLNSIGVNAFALIADFGLARDIYQHDYYKKTGQGS